MGTGSESSRCLSPFFPNALRQNAALDCYYLTIFCTLIVHVVVLVVAFGAPTASPWISICLITWRSTGLNPKDEDCPVLSWRDTHLASVLRGDSGRQVIHKKRYRALETILLGPIDRDLHRHIAAREYLVWTLDIGFENHFRRRCMGHRHNEFLESSLDVPDPAVPVARRLADWWSPPRIVCF